MTVIWTLIKESNYKAVIVCPSSLISNWEKEVARWIGDFRCRPSVVRPGQNNKDLIQAFTYGNSPILIISYDMFRKFAADLNKISRFNILVCDEGHRLKNTCGTKTMDSLTTCKATMRLVLTGTPIQNDLDELHSVVSFVAPGFLGSLSTFKTWIAGPILRLREPNCSTHDKRAGELAMKNMRLLMNQILLRRTQADVLRGSLPPRIDVIIQCRLSDRQKEQYEEEVQELFRNIGVSSSEIRRHTQSSLTHCNNTEPEDTDTGTHTRNIMPDDEAEEDNSSATISYSSVLPSLQRLRQISNGVVEDKTITSSTTATSNSFSTATSNLVQSGKDLIGLSQASKKARVSDDKTNLGGSQKVINNAISGGSSKLQVLVTLLSSIHEHDPTERVVIVSNFTGVLDRVATLATAHHWAYLRLDGSTVIKKRQQLVDTFNEGMDSSYLFLLSSKAGGVGLNLIGASRLIMMDADWNPATDRQAMGRIWRPGQKRSVVIYRLVADKTIECSILQRQTMKIGLSAVFGTETSDKSVQPASSGNKDIAANSTTSTKQSGAAVKVSTSDEPFVTTQWAFDALSDPVETTVEAEDTVVGNQVDEATLLDDKTDMDVNSTELGFTVPECGFASIWTKSSLVQLVLPTSSPAVIGELSMIEKNEKLDVSTGMFFSDPIAQQV